MWNGTIFVDLDWPLNASSLLSASAELLVVIYFTVKFRNHLYMKLELKPPPSLRYECGAN